MNRIRFGKRLGEVRQRLKRLLYAKIGALLQGELDTDRADYALGLFLRINELEMQDGNGALERVLNGLPKVAAAQIRQELRLLVDVGKPCEGEERLDAPEAGLSEEGPK